MPTADQMPDRFVELVHRFLHERPRLVLPDERVAAIKEQMHSLRDSAAGNPEDRMFLYRILAMLGRSQNPPTMGELSAELGIPMSSATRMADGLVRAHLAQRCADAKDRRIVRLCLTDRGQKFIEMTTDFMKQRIAHLLKHFSAEEQGQLLRLMTKLIDSLQAEKQ